METPNALSTQSHELLVKANDIIYEQNTVSDGVYIIIEGRIEISHEDKGELRHIAFLEAGSLLGEVGAIEKTPRSVTATAIIDSKLLFIEAASFQRIFQHEDPLIRYIIETLANRLRASYTSDSSLTAIQGESYYIKQFTKRDSFMIGADSPIMEKLLQEPIEIMTVPFSVSNSPKMKGDIKVTHTELRIPLPQNPELSIPHFEIVSRDGILWVRDLGSNFGTIVNGHTISRYGEEGVAMLNPGFNRIVAGSSDSVIRFLIQVPWDG